MKLGNMKEATARFLFPDFFITSFPISSIFLFLPAPY